MIDTRPPRYEADPVVAVPPSLLKRISWGAIFAGAIIALGLTILFGLLGMAIGFRVVDPQSTSPFHGLGIGTAIWWIVTSIISLAVGGFVAGRGSGQPDRFASTAHGAATWGIVTIATVWLATSAVGTAVNTATGAVTTVARTGAQVVGAVGGAVLPDNIDLSPQLSQARDQIRQEADQILGEAGIGDRQLSQAQRAVENTAENIVRQPGTLDEEVGGLIDRLFRSPNAVFSQQDRRQLSEALAARAGMTPEEADQVVGRWETQAQSATTQIGDTISDVRSQAGAIGEDALDALSSASWYAFFASLLSLGAAVLAAGIGAPRHPLVAA